MIESGLYSLLSTTLAITNICETRIYPVILPTEPKYPCLIYQLISVKTTATLSTSGLQRWRYQFDCFGESYNDSVGLRTALVQALDGYQGVLTDGTLLQNMDLVQLIDGFESDARTYRCAAEFYLYFNFKD